MSKRLFDRSYTSSAFTTLYHHLKLNIGASVTEVENQYTQIRKEYSPQKPVPKNIEKAYKVLSNPLSKAAYDQSLRRSPYSESKETKTSASPTSNHQTESVSSSTTTPPCLYKILDYRLSYLTAAPVLLLTGFEQYGCLNDHPWQGSLDKDFMIGRYQAWSNEEKNSFLTALLGRVEITQDEKIKSHLIALLKLLGSVDYTNCVGFLANQMYLKSAATNHDFGIIYFRPGSYHYGNLKSWYRPEEFKKLTLHEQEQFLCSWSGIPFKRNYGFFQMEARPVTKFCLLIYQLFTQIEEYRPRHIPGHGRG